MNIFVPCNFVYLCRDFCILDFWSRISGSKEVDRHCWTKVLIWICVYSVYHILYIYIWYMYFMHRHTYTYLNRVPVSLNPHQRCLYFVVSLPGLLPTGLCKGNPLCYNSFIWFLMECISPGQKCFKILFCGTTIYEISTEYYWFNCKDSSSLTLALCLHSLLLPPAENWIENNIPSSQCSSRQEKLVLVKMGRQLQR